MGGREPVLPQALGAKLGDESRRTPGNGHGSLVRIWSARGCETEQTGTNLCEPEALLRQGLSRVYQAQQEVLHRFPKPGVTGSIRPRRPCLPTDQIRLFRVPLVRERGGNEVDRERTMVQIHRTPPLGPRHSDLRQIGAGRSAFSRSPSSH